MTLVALTLQPQVLAMHLCKNCAQKPRQNNHHNNRHSQVVLFLWMRVFKSGVSVVGFICSSPPPPPEGRQWTCDTLKKVQPENAMVRRHNAKSVTCWEIGNDAYSGNDARMLYSEGMRK